MNQVVCAVALLLLCGCGHSDPIADLQKAGGIVIIGDQGTPVAAGFKDANITDADIKLLTKIEGIDEVGIDNVRISDLALKELASIKSLKRLSLSDVPITGAGFKDLPQHLEGITIYNVPVEDSGLSYLADIKSLKLLVMAKTKVTENGENAFKAKRPEVNFRSKND